MRQAHRTLLLGLGIAISMAQSAFAAYDLPYIGEMKEYRTKYEDTFVHVARDFNIGFVEIRAANPFVDPWIPGSGTKIIIPDRHILPNAPREGIVINLADMRLYAYYDKNKAPFSTPVGVGREGLNTPLGTTTIVRKVVGPTWRPTERMRREDPKLPAVVPPGDENPMGTHALYLGFPLVAIHGTNKPFGIGRRSSSGCLRLYPEAITKVYDMFPVGTKVTVVNQPIKVAWIGDELFLEASPTVEQSTQMEENGEVKEQKLSNEEMKLIIKAAGAYQDRLRWPTIRKAIKERNSYPVAIARRPGMEVQGDQVVHTGEQPKYETPEEAKDLIEGYKGPKKSADRGGEQGSIEATDTLTNDVAEAAPEAEQMGPHKPAAKNAFARPNEPRKRRPEDLSADEELAVEEHAQEAQPQAKVHLISEQPGAQKKAVKKDAAQEAPAFDKRIKTLNP
jgi:L,D-transpeptidase ErfK/SrfK